MRRRLVRARFHPYQHGEIVDARGDRRTGLQLRQQTRLSIPLMLDMLNREACGSHVFPGGAKRTAIHLRHA